MVDTLDATQWPRYMFHPEKEPTCVETPEEEGELLDLDESWRRTPYSDIEKLEHQQVLKQETRGRGDELRQELEEPIKTPPRQSAAVRKKERDALSYQRRKRKRAEP